MKKTQKLIISALAVLVVLLSGVLVFLHYRERVVKDTAVTVYMLRYDDNIHRAFLVPLEREATPGLAVDERIKLAMDNLIEGLKEEERLEGYTTSIPEDAYVRSILIKDGIAHIDFSSDIERGGGTMLMTERLAQIVFTATQFRGVNKVRFLIEGSFIDYFSGEGITEVEKPLGREHFDDFKE